MTLGNDLDFCRYTCFDQYLITFISFACGFADDNDSSYIITGGSASPKTVSRYGKSGWMEDLPSLNTERWHHGCGTYLDSENNRVS